MATMNIFSAGGILRRMEERTTGGGAPYVQLFVGVEEYSRDEGRHEILLGFSLFGDQAEAARAMLCAGDDVVVTGKFRLNGRGYLDTQATGFVVVRKAVNVPPLPQDSRRSAPPAAPYAAQPVLPLSRQSPRPPQYGAQGPSSAPHSVQDQVDKALDDTPF